MQNACDSDSGCALACDASTCDAKSLAMWVERCEPLRRGRFDENGENDEFAFDPQKTKASLLRTPKTTKVTKMAGVTQAEA